MSIKINNDTANGSVTLQASNTATGDVVATLPPFSTELAPRMQLMTAKTASGTSVYFTGIPSWAKKITVMFNGVSTNGASPIQIQLGTNIGIDTANYNGATIHIDASANSNPSAMSSGFKIESVTSGAVVRYGNAILSTITSNSFMFLSQIGRTDITGLHILSTGSKTISEKLTTIHITTVNGTDTFDAGTINILVEG